MAIMWTDDKSDVASLLDGDYRAAIAVLDSFEKHVVNHQSDIPPAIYQNLIESIAGAVSALRGAECHACESVALEVHRWDLLCASCATKERA